MSNHSIQLGSRVAVPLRRTALYLALGLIYMLVIPTVSGVLALVALTNIVQF